VLGTPAVTGETGTVAGAGLGGRRARVALVALALARTTVLSERLADMIWADDRPATWPVALRGVVRGLRSALAEIGGGEQRVIVTEPRGYRLAPDVGVDLALAERDVQEAAELNRRGRHRAALDLAGPAARIAGSQLLAGEDSEWLRPHRAMADAVARQALESAAHHDPRLAALGTRVSEAAYLVSDVAAELASYAQSVEADPARLAAVQERRADLARLVRTYGTATVGPAGRETDPADQADLADPADQGKQASPGGPGEAARSREPEPPGGDLAAVLRWAKAAASRLGELDSDDDKIAALEQDEATLAAAVAEQAAALTAARTQTAGRFAAQVTAELAALAMPHASLTVAVTPAQEYGPYGADEVEIRLAAHPGAPALPLSKGASGGELSRVMLAIEVVFAGADPVPTFVFDEVDAGVGGKAAVEIGRRLARLARLAQVIVVTHLPQVAAFADTHLVVEKSDTGAVISSGITRLDDDGRVRELSRMLAGLEDSEFGRAHAGELLAAAAAERAGLGG